MWAHEDSSMGLLLSSVAPAAEKGSSSSGDDSDAVPRCVVIRSPLLRIPGRWFPVDFLVADADKAALDDLEELIAKRRTKGHS
jgi:hypothetical protein